MTGGFAMPATLERPNVRTAWGRVCARHGFTPAERAGFRHYAREKAGPNPPEHVLSRLAAKYAEGVALPARV
jgi:hypothetical protein